MTNYDIAYIMLITLTIISTTMIGNTKESLLEIFLTILVLIVIMYRFIFNDNKEVIKHSDELFGDKHKMWLSMKFPISVILWITTLVTCLTKFTFIQNIIILFIFHHCISSIIAKLFPLKTN